MDRVYGLFAQYVDGEKEYRVYEGEVIKEIATGKGTQTFVDFGWFKYCYAETDFGKTAFATREEAQRKKAYYEGFSGVQMDPQGKTLLDKLRNGGKH